MSWFVVCGSLPELLDDPARRLIERRVRRKCERGTGRRDERRHAGLDLRHPRSLRLGDSVSIARIRCSAVSTSVASVAWLRAATTISMSFPPLDQQHRQDLRQPREITRDVLGRPPRDADADVDDGLEPRVHVDDRHDAHHVELAEPADR